MTIDFDASDLDGIRQTNRRLEWMPRLRLQSPVHRGFIQGLLGLADRFGPNLAARRGVLTEVRTVSALGRTARVRILRPSRTPLGIHVHIHGGGWTIGNARMDDDINAALAIEQGAVVVSVDYRLIPENTLTDCIDDCETAARWVLETGLDEFGVEKMTIGGESAGGHLAAATILRLRDTGFNFDRVTGAALVFGCYDLEGTEMRKRAGPETLVLHGPTMGRILDGARDVTPEARASPAFSPIKADLAGLPPALFVVGTRDPLQEDSELMHAKWAKQSGNAELALVPEAAHGFTHQRNSTAAKANAYVRRWIGARLKG